jgi:ribosomal-protein-alanine N-acetyltransferase
MQTKFSTQRLLLDLIAEDDHDFIFSLVNSKGWLEFIGDRNVHSKQDSIEYIMRIINAPDLFYWVVRLKENNTTIGIISFLKRSYLEHFDIGFAFLPEFYGYGYAYEATEKVLSIVSKKAEYATILATTIPQNINSIKLLNKLGFHFEKEIEVLNEKLYVYTNSQIN